MSINGIPVKIKTPDKDGQLTQLETIYFPTFRKCPKLAKYPKMLSHLETAVDKGRRKITLAMQAMDNADLDQLDAAAEVVDAAKEELFAMDEKMTNGFDDFVVTGLNAAGYQEADIKRYLEFIDMSRLDELIQCSRMGAGRVDFFTEEK